MSDLTIWLWLEDHDNADLNHGDWLEQLEEAVRTYNQEYGTSYDPKKTTYQYINRKGDHDE